MIGSDGEALPGSGLAPRLQCLQLRLPYRKDSHPVSLYARKSSFQE